MAVALEQTENRGRLVQDNMRLARRIGPRQEAAVEN
jgi:hypothetical protein